MEVADETCKLCLKYIQGANLAVLDETLSGKLEFLQMDLNQSVEEGNSVCKECEEKIENAFDFKSCLVNTESCLVPYVSEDKTQKVNLRVIVEKDSPSSSVGESSAEKEVCRLCKNFVDAIAVISLPKILKDDSMMEVFQRHIPEMDLDVTENPVVCELCQKSLASFSTLIASWSIANGWNDDDDDEDMKEDLSDFEMEVKKEGDEFSDSNTNSSVGIVDISDSVKTGRKAKSKNGQTDKVKSESEDLSDSCASEHVAKKFKSEEAEDESMEDLQLKNEEVEIKDEDGIDQEFEKDLDGMDNQNFEPDVKLCRSLERSIVTKNQRKLQQKIIRGNPNFNKHGKLHKSLDESKIYECQQCSFITKDMFSLKRHYKIHKNVVQTYVCKQCTFITETKISMREHNLTHKNIGDVQTYKCSNCSYVTKSKRYWSQHCKTLECPECSHVTKGTCNLKRHCLTTHLTQLGPYKCKECPFITKYSRGFSNHLRVHKKSREVPKHKCPECSYVTVTKSRLKRHCLTHLTELEPYKCQECPFKTKTSQALENHLKAHKSSSRVRKFKCQHCSYQINENRGFQKHLKLHEGVEKNTYTCG